MRHQSVLVLAGAVISATFLVSPSRADEAVASLSGERSAMIAQIQQAEDKLIDLAGAIPEAKYSWRPRKGVRSVAEVFRHVVTSNYLFPTWFGTRPPAGFDMKNYEAGHSDREQIVQDLKASFAHLRKAIADTPDGDLTKTVKIGDHDGTEREGMMIAVTHAHEHLGQSIAYARMIGIVPPWTAREQAEGATAKAKASKEAVKH
jgi:uncharacterized damage-inducible protein DinB